MCYELTVLRYGQDHAGKDHHDLRNPRLFLLFLAQAAMYIFFFFLIPKRGTIHLVVQSIFKLTARALSTVIMEYTNYVKVERLAYEQGVI